MKDTLNIINRMQADGVIGPRYRRRRCGATFYLEPAATYDLDVFVFRPGTRRPDHHPHSTPISNNTAARQTRNTSSLPAGQCSSCPQEARWRRRPSFKPSKPPVDGIPTRVMTAEHLVAIALKTGRAEDKLRVVQFLESDAVDRPRLLDIITRHGLSTQWQAFCEKYLKATHE